jgi:hypothetical protein
VYGIQISCQVNTIVVFEQQRKSCRNQHRRLPASRHEVTQLT